jgi:hypothetical protein
MTAAFIFLAFLALLTMCAAGMMIIIGLLSAMSSGEWR